jgi:hypothetical protein
MNNLNSPGAAVSRAASEERAETLRRCVPRALVALSAATSLEKLKAAMADLGEQAGLLCIAIVCASDRRSQRFRWHSSSTASSWRDEACTKFDITDGREALEMQFFTDGTTGIVGPTTRILLQLVADAAEASLMTSLEQQEDAVPSAIRPEGRILLSGQ